MGEQNCKNGYTVRAKIKYTGLTRILANTTEDNF
jgi:hypothetical protein